MRTVVTRLTAVALVLLGFAGSPSSADAVIVSYGAYLDGPSESPPNASPGIGVGQVDIDFVAFHMRVRVSFGGLLSPVTVAHIHAPTAVPLQGTIGVATMLPTFPGFPAGVTAGTYDGSFDMRFASSYSPTYLANFGGGDPLTAFAALAQHLAEGRAYLNIHTNLYPGGEIRGFLVPGNPLPTEQSTWGRVKALFR